jgi:hypothetical protein
MSFADRRPDPFFDPAPGKENHKHNGYQLEHLGVYIHEIYGKGVPCPVSVRPQPCVGVHKGASEDFKGRAKIPTALMGR